MAFKIPQLCGANKFSFYISLLFFVFCTLFTELAINQYQKNEQHKQFIYTQKVSDSIQTTLLASINETFRLNGLRAYLIATQGKIRPEELNAILANYFPKIGPDQLIRSINVAPDNQIQYIFPLTGNQKELGLRLTEQPKQWPFFERAIQQKQPNLIGPLDLVDGVSELIYSAPVFISENNYWGMINVAINANQIFDFINDKINQQHLQVALRGRNAEGDKGEVFWGEASLFEGEGVLSTIKVPGGAWQLIGKSATINLKTLSLIHLTGILLVGLLAILLFTFLKAVLQRKILAKQLVKTASHSPGMIFQFHLKTDGSICMPYVSEGIRDLYQLSPEDVRDDASKLFSLFQTEDLGDIKAAIHKSAHDLCEFIYEFRVLQLDGTMRWLLAKSMPQRETDGSTLWYGFSTDITNLKHLEDKLLTSKNLLKIIIDSIPANIYVFDLQNRFILTNKRAADFFGSDPESLFGKTLHEFFPKEIADNKIRHINQVKIIQEPVVFEEELISAASGDQCTLLVSKFPIKTKEGNIYGVGTVAMDITERKKSEDLLSLRNTALSTINQGVIISDAQQNILWANKAYKELTGYSLSDLKGRNCRNLLQGALTDPETIKNISMALKAKRTFSGEILNYRKDGSTFWNELTILPIFNNKHQITNFMSTGRDMTEIKESELALILGKSQAEHASIVKSQFLAMMSHEIRTPLNAILGMQELLTHTLLNPVQTDYLQLATQAGQNLLAIVNDILDLTKVEAGKLELEQVPFDVIELTDLCVQLLTLSAREKDLTLVIDVAPELTAWISGDSLRYRQVLINLLSNAIKFTEKGEVTIKLSVQPTPKNSCELLIEVVDTGIGIPLASQAGLFEVFVQVDPSDTRKYGGSGLGLAISKRLVDLWQGHIGVESTPGVGSRFWFTVGSKAIAPVLKITPTFKVDENAQRPFIVNVLVIDDSLINQAVVAYMLRNAGHYVDLADSGNAGIAAVKKQNYDIILMDVSMPDMSGMEATKLIRKLGGAAALVPIIAITAHALAGYQALCLEAGMNGYATKPISQKDLLAVVATWCDKTVTHEALVSDGLIEDSSVQPLYEPDKQKVILDQAALDELISLLGQEPFNDLLQIYLTELTTRCDTIKQALIQQDLVIISREAHTIKSSSASFGATALQVIAKDLEACGYNEDLPQAFLLAEQLFPCAAATMAAISTI
jgi:PAS domain S-box-containing protein